MEYVTLTQLIQLQDEIELLKRRIEELENNGVTE